MRFLPITHYARGSIKLVNQSSGLVINTRALATGTEQCRHPEGTVPVASLLQQSTSTALTKHSNEIKYQDLLLPDLMPVPVNTIIDRAGIFHTMYNWYISRLLMPNVYNNFIVKDFLADAKKTIETISQNLAAQQYFKLHGILTHEALAQSKRSIDHMSEEQRERIALKSYDIVKMYVQKARWVYSDGIRPDGCYAEVTMVFHVHQPFKANPKNLNDYLDK